MDRPLRGRRGVWLGQSGPLARTARWSTSPVPSETPKMRDRPGGTPNAEQESRGDGAAERYVTAHSAFTRSAIIAAERAVAEAAADPEAARYSRVSVVRTERTIVSVPLGAADVCVRTPEIPRRAAHQRGAGSPQR